jgi:K+-transporting ATPase ATPase A chain
MNFEIISIIFTFLITLLAAYPLGIYIKRVFKNEKVWSDFLSPLEKIIFKISGVNTSKSMTWQENTRALLILNLIFFLWAIVALMTQTYHPFWNPDHIGSMEWTQAFNTAVSFMTNTNLQHYSGETGASYFTQLLVFCFLQFVSAGTGIAASALIFKGLATTQTKELGNFYVLFLKSCTRILLPLAILVAIFLVFNGTPVTFEGATSIQTINGDTIKVARGPVASMVAIKQMGTNGGGYFGPNSTHPFENPNYLTNIVESWSILLIPIALVFAFGFYLEKKRLAWLIFLVMLSGFLLLLIPTIILETAGNPALAKLGVNQTLGSMEGKEIRFGTAASAYWGIATTCTSNGSVNSMHDSFTPLSGMFLLLGMMVNAFFGGVGVGFINMFIFVILAIFIAGLMVGRTPEFLGKKIESQEVKIAALITILHPLLILVGTAISAYWVSKNPQTPWLANPSFHGFSEMLYEFTSASANNGSGFEGLGDNTPFWNLLTGCIMLLGRFLPIIGPLMIAGLLAEKKNIPISAGTLPTDNWVFGLVLFSVIFIVSALAFFPVLVLGPIAEFFTL